MPKYHMRKSEREVTDQSELLEVLRRGKYTVISMCRNNEPYIVTLNYGYDEDRNALYFHCGIEGLKVDFINRNPIVCGTVIEDKGYIQGECAHAYRTVVFWGEMRVVHDLAEKKHGMQVLLSHLEDDPDEIERRHLTEDKAYDRLGVLRLDIHELSGKQGQ